MPSLQNAYKYVDGCADPVCSFQSGKQIRYSEARFVKSGTQTNPAYKTFAKYVCEFLERRACTELATSPRPSQMRQSGVLQFRINKTNH